MGSYALLLLSPICWASWLNFKLLCKGWRFESFYVNYALTITATTFGYGAWEAGSPAAFWASVTQHDPLVAAEATFAGVIWGVGNVLLVAVITLCGLAVGLKIAIGLSLVLGVILTYLVDPGATNNPRLLMLGVVVVGLALLANSSAYRVREQSRGRSVHRGITLAVVCGVLIGTFPLLQGLAIAEGLGGVQTAFLLTVGNLLVCVPLLPYLARQPIIPGERPIRLWREYTWAPPLWHLWAGLAGAVWAIGTIANLNVAVSTVGLSIAWAVGECSPLIGMLWGVFVFREFDLTNLVAYRKAHKMLILTVLLYSAGIVLLLLAS